MLLLGYTSKNITIFTEKGSDPHICTLISVRLTHSALGLDPTGLRVTHAAVALMTILWAAGKAS